MKKLLFVLTMFLLSQTALAASALDDAFKEFAGTDNLAFDAKRGDQLWHKKYDGEDGKPRSCEACHGTDLKKSGKHNETGKTIDPMAPSVNNERFTDLKKIHKWFKRNCKWTVGRECTNQEKGDLLKYLSQL